MILSFSIYSLKNIKFKEHNIYSFLVFILQSEVNNRNQLISKLMSDIFSKKKRSEIMSSIRGSKNKSTELRLIEIFKAHDITGWRRNSKLSGKPDFVFPRNRLILFVDGCFWHGCPKHYVLPTTNIEFWKKKIASNKARDRKINHTLKQKGWYVLRIWQHALTRKGEKRTVARIRKALES